MRDADDMTGEELGNKLLESVRQMKRGEAARVTQVEVPKAAEVRHRMGLSQKEFADLLNVSLGTLRGWEQGRREPTGTARTLLRVAEKHPEVLRDLA
ncbi:helix-turn-helix domain-containing protein [Halomonas campisalis]|uniref:Helix-turn-helix domain-containing protein n=1 Tax=Billgrantia campisalis TaxID=74661 RepID=A0ABS9P369_9GAMM|nr:helix-turn-helix domain-containing protein [Halomonas campisalis]MCG6656228.1 helix-turn-helix domain-containing protein [Halomonas campisalis]MDR5861415.1 helix-turn-helix domain-containing protein [Halomonas campisalis]